MKRMDIMIFAASEEIALRNEEHLLWSMLLFEICISQPVPLIVMSFPLCTCASAS